MGRADSYHSIPMALFPVFIAISKYLWSATAQFFVTFLGLYLTIPLFSCFFSFPVVGKVVGGGVLVRKTLTKDTCLQSETPSSMYFRIFIRVHLVFRLGGWH